jgi:hypothetical protein
MGLDDREYTRLLLNASRSEFLTLFGGVDMGGWGGLKNVFFVEQAAAEGVDGVQEERPLIMIEIDRSYLAIQVDS